MIYDLLASPLILVTPFVSFVNYNDYSYAAPELWLCLAGLIALGLFCGAIMTLGGTWVRIIGTAGLITLAIDLQFDVLEEQPWIRVPAFGIGMVLLCWLAREHLSRIVTPVFATMLVSTIALHVLGGAASSNPARTHATIEPAPDSDLPTIVHIILDEHIGIEGIPDDVQHGRETKALLKSFYRSYGFRLFGRAYSRYSNTRNSVPNMLNYASEPLDRSWVEGDRAVVLRSNRYFHDMHRAGYQIHAFQIAWLNLCKPAEQIIASCYTEDHTGIKALEGVNFSLDEKVLLFYRLYGGLSVINSAFIYWNTTMRGFAARNGWSWPEWWLRGVGMPAIRAMYSLSVLGDQVRHSSPGQIFFAHVLFPHNPYIYDMTCKERKPADWEDATEDAPLPPNTAASRSRRYGLYLEQIWCVRAKLQEMFDGWRRAGVYDRLKIIVQGDHGSRIVMNRPHAANKDRLVTSDYVDAFSTLLAIKEPGAEPAYDERMVAIQDQLGAAAHGHALEQSPANGTARPYVLLENGAAMMRQPMPDFGDPSRAEDPLHLSQP